MTDIFLRDEGTVVVFTPVSPEATEWIDEHVQAEAWQWLGNGLCVDHRFARDLFEGMVGAGLEVRAG